jgi:hypothetical protein
VRAPGGSSTTTSWQAYTGSLLTTSASLNATIEQARIQRTDELRVQRTQGYDELLSAATSVRTTTNDFVRSCPAVRVAGVPPVSAACDESKLDEAVDRFQRASFRINAIASANGQGAAIQLGAALPIKGYRFADGSLHAIDRVVFSEAYENALRVMCLDIRTDDKTRCP